MLNTTGLCLGVRCVEQINDANDVGCDADGDVLPGRDVIY
jgi:hypothetical protein